MVESVSYLFSNGSLTITRTFIACSSDRTWIIYRKEYEMKELFKKRKWKGYFFTLSFWDIPSFMFHKTPPDLLCLHCWPLIPRELWVRDRCTDFLATLILVSMQIVSLSVPSQFYLMFCAHAVVPTYTQQLWKGKEVAVLSKSRLSEARWRWIKGSFGFSFRNCATRRQGSWNIGLYMEVGW